MSERKFWHFDTIDDVAAYPPEPSARDAIDFLIDHRISHEIDQGSSRREGARLLLLLNFRGFTTILAEYFGPTRLGHYFGSSHTGPASSKEQDTMHDERDEEEEFQFTRDNLKWILANPALAEEVYPDEQIRENILSFLDGMKARADAAEQKKKAREQSDEGHTKT